MWARHTGTLQDTHEQGQESRGDLKMWQVFVQQLHWFSVAMGFCGWLCWFVLIVVYGRVLAWAVQRNFKHKKKLKQTQSTRTSTSPLSVLDPDVIRYTPEHILRWIGSATKQNSILPLVLFDLRIEPILRDAEDVEEIAAAKSQTSAVFRMLMTSVQDILNQCKSADRVGTVTGGCYSATWSGGQLHCLLLLVPKHANVYGIGTDSVEAVEDLVVCKWSVNDFPLCHVWVDSIRTIPEGATDNVVVDLVRELDHRGEDISTYLSRSRGVFGCFRSTTTKGN